MKKILATLLSALLVAGTAATSAMAWEVDTDYVIMDEWADTSYAYGDAYPGSVEWDWPEVTSGTLLKGTIIAGFNGSSHCWSNGSDNAVNAFDGDTETFFDPFDATSASWAGMMLDQPYELTEIRVYPRSTFSTRLPGAAIQGSNDGETWTDIVFIDKAATGLTDAPNGVDYHCFTPETNDTYVAANTDLGAAEPDFSVYWVGEGAYSIYRYVNINGEHGDVGEIELYGNPASAAAEEAPAAAEVPAEEAVEEAPAAEETPVAEEVAEVPVAEDAEAVEETVEAPAAEEAVEEAPQTFDAGIIAAVAAVVSAAGYAISKKRR